LNEDPYCKKILIVRNVAAGHQLIRRLSREFGPVSNLVIHSPESLALSQAKLQLSEVGLEYLPQDKGYWITFSAMQSLAEEPGGYVPSSMLTPGVVRCFHSAIIELREACVDAVRLTEDQFEQPAKGLYIRRLLRAYSEALQEGRFVDLASLTPYVEPLRDSSQDVLFLLDGSIRLSRALEAALQRIFGGREPFVFGGSASFTAADSGFPHQRMSYFHALGPLSETRECIRRMAEAREPWDNVEWIVSDYPLYAPIVDAVCRQLEIPCTFSQGLAFRTTRAGRAALLFLEWIESNYRVDSILAAAKQGYLQIPAETASFADATGVLEASGIGWGRQRYSLLSASSYRNEGKASAARWWSGMFDDLFRRLPKSGDGEWSPKHVTDALACFPHYCQCGATEADSEAARMITQLQQSLSRWGCRSIGLKRSIRFVRECLEEASVGARGIPEPGKLHISV
jgi:ATP-dependent helicase/nuclease subunit B